MQRQGYQSGVGGRGRGIRTVYKSGASVALVFSLFRAARSILITASCLLAVAASCILYPVSCPALQAEDEVMRIQKAYEGVRDIKGNFIQKSHIKDLKRTDTYRGEFFIKSSKMKWEYKGDKPQAIYINGDDIIVYQKKEKQALKARFDRATYGQAPIALLGGFGTISGEFNASMARGKLVLTPKQPMGNVTRIEITLSERDFPIESLTVIDSHTNAIEIQLKDVKLNTGLKERMFEFVPPDGVTVLQQEQ